MPCSGDLKTASADTHLRERVQKTSKSDGIGGFLQYYRIELHSLILIYISGTVTVCRIGSVRPQPSCLLSRNENIAVSFIRVDGIHLLHIESEGEMGLLKRTLIGLLRSFEQTGDRAKDPLLKSHYYKLSKEKAWAEVVSTLKKMQGYKVLHEVESVGEIVLEKRTVTGRMMDITVSIIGTNPVTSAVDIYSASRGSLGDLGSNYRVILDIYRTLDKKLAAYKVSSP